MDRYIERKFIPKKSADKSRTASDSEENFDSIIPLYRYKGPFDDLDWITEKLDTFQGEARKNAAIQYSMLFKQFYDSEKVAHKKNNAGRKHANKWLREAVIASHVDYLTQEEV